MGVLIVWRRLMQMQYLVHIETMLFIIIKKAMNKAEIFIYCFMYK